MAARTNLFLSRFSNVFDPPEAPESLTLFDAAQSELDQMLGFESSAGPSVALFEFDSDEVIHLVESAVPDAGLATVVRELKGYHRVRRDRLFHLQTRARRRYVPEYCPIAAHTSGSRLPLNFYKISAQVPVFLSFSLHDCMYRQIGKRVYSTMIPGSKNPESRSRKKTKVYLSAHLWEIAAHRLLFLLLTSSSS
jgi:hypothetical protein